LFAELEKGLLGEWLGEEISHIFSSGDILNVNLPLFLLFLRVVILDLQVLDALVGGLLVSELDSCLIVLLDGGGVCLG
jgi:hypothetical protein